MNSLKSATENQAESIKPSSGRKLEKLIVSYFGYIGFYLLFSFYVLRFIPLQIVSSFAAIIFTALYLPILRLLWRQWKVAIGVAIGSLLSLYVLGIGFIFTAPIWIIFSPVCLIYAFLTGLFKKEKQISQPAENIRPASSKFFQLLKPFIGVAVLSVLLCGSYHIAFYGFKLVRCVYTDEELIIPAELKNAKILLEKNMYIAKGSDPDHCSPLLKDIKNQLVSNEAIDNTTDGMRYFTEKGLVVETQLKGKTFALNKFIVVTEQGLSAKVWGSGPFYYLVLIDEQGAAYQIHTAHLGLDENESYFSYSNNGVKQGMLSWRWFEDYNKK